MKAHCIYNGRSARLREFASRLVDIMLKWSQPIQLSSGASENLIYSLDVDSLPQTAGLYVFGRRRGQMIIPVYVGQALRLRGRVKRQLNNAKLMLALKKTPNRRKYITYAEIVGKPGQSAKKVLNVVEKAFIEHALAEGHDIVNVQGTKRRKHFITSTGGRAGRTWIPKQLSPAKKQR